VVRSDSPGRWRTFGTRLFAYRGDSLLLPRDTREYFYTLFRLILSFWLSENNSGRPWSRELGRTGRPGGKIPAMPSVLAHSPVSATVADSCDCCKSR
jgi:hypothetical protein